MTDHQMLTEWLDRLPPFEIDRVTANGAALAAPNLMAASGIGTEYTVDGLENPGVGLMFAVRLASGPVTSRGYLGAFETWSRAGAWVVEAIRQELDNEGDAAAGPAVGPIPDPAGTGA